MLYSKLKHTQVRATVLVIPPASFHHVCSSAFKYEADNKRLPVPARSVFTCSDTEVKSATAAHVVVRHTRGFNVCLHTG